MNKIEKSKTNFVKYIFFEQKYIDKFHDISQKILDTHWSGFDEACHSLVSRIHGITTSKTFNFVFKPRDLPTLVQKIDDFYG